MSDQLVIGPQIDMSLIGQIEFQRFATNKNGISATR